MKKLIILFLLMFSSLPLIHINADIIEANYDLTYTHGYWYDLFDGTFEANPNYSVTNRNEILFGSLILDSIDSFHHLIYFDKNLKMIGYMNTALTDIETDLFIDNILSFTPDIPPNAVYFALMGFYPYLNNTPIPEINNLTLGQVFGGSYDVDTTYNVLSSKSFLDIAIGELNNHTLREVFEGGNVLEDPTFTIGGKWTFGGSWSTNNYLDNYTSNISQVKTVTNEQLYFNYKLTSLTSARLGFTNQSDLYFYTLTYKTTGQYSVLIPNVSFTQFRLYGHVDGGTFTLNHVYAIKTTSLGISSLTVSQMDYWFKVYQSIKTGTTQFPTGYVDSGTGYVFYSNTTTNVLLTVNVFTNNFIDNSYYSPIYQDTFDELLLAQQTNQLSTWTNNMWQLLDFVDLNWFPTQTALTNYYTIYQNNILYDDFYFDDIELTVSQPTVSYEYNLDVDNRGIVDYLNDLLDDIGLGSDGVKFAISLVMVVIVMGVLWLFKVPTLIVIMGGLLMTILFIIMGWVPIYLVVIITAVLFYLIATSKGGNNDA